MNIRKDHSAEMGRASLLSHGTTSQARDLHYAGLLPTAMNAVFNSIETNDLPENPEKVGSNT